MKRSPNVKRYAEQWLNKADKDLKTVKQLLSAQDAEWQFEVVCFHAQQCVEKSIKALLTLYQIEFPKSHDIEKLVYLLPKGVVIPMTKKEQEQITEFAVDTRYPGPFECIERTEAEEVSAVAEKVLNAVSVIIKNVK